MPRSANQFRPTRRTVSPTGAECKPEAFCQPSLACQPAAFFQPAPRCQPAPRPTSAVCQPHCRADRRLFANAVLEPTRFRQNSPVLPTGTVVPTGDFLPTTVVPPVSAARASHEHAWVASRRLCGLVRGSGAETETGGLRSSRILRRAMHNAPRTGAARPAPSATHGGPLAACRLSGRPRILAPRPSGISIDRR